MTAKIGPKESARRALRETSVAKRKPRSPRKSERQVMPHSRQEPAVPAQSESHNATPPATHDHARGASRATLAPPGQCEFCDERRKRAAAAMRHLRQNKGTAAE